MNNLPYIGTFAFSRTRSQFLLVQAISRTLIGSSFGFKTHLQLFTRLAGDILDGSTNGVAAIQVSLWALQYLDAFHVIHFQQSTSGGVQVDIINVYTTYWLFQDGVYDL